MTGAQISERKESERNEATGENDDLLEGKPYITKIEKLHTKIYVYRNKISNLERLIQDHVNDRINKNYFTEIQEQLKNISV